MAVFLNCIISSTFKNVTSLFSTGAIKTKNLTGSIEAKHNIKSVCIVEKVLSKIKRVETNVFLFPVYLSFCNSENFPLLATLGRIKTQL